MQCLGLAGACAAYSHRTATAWGSFQTLTTLTRRPLSVSRALHVLSSCVLCLAPRAVYLLEALDRCVCPNKRAWCFCLILRVFNIYIALLLLPLSFFLGVGAPSLSLAGFMIKAKAVRRGSLSFSWFVDASAACVYEAGLLLVCGLRVSHFCCFR